MTQEIRSPMAATVVEMAVSAGQAVRAGDLLAIVEAMKMEHELRAPHDARVLALLARPGELVGEGDGLLRLARCTPHLDCMRQGVQGLCGELDTVREAVDAALAAATARLAENWDETGFAEQMRLLEARREADARLASLAERDGNGD